MKQTDKVILAIDLQTTGLTIDYGISKINYSLLVNNVENQKGTLLVNAFDYTSLYEPKALEYNRTTVQSIQQYPPSKQVVDTLFNLLAPYTKVSLMAYGVDFDKEHLLRLFEVHGLKDYIEHLLTYESIDTRDILNNAIHKGTLADTPLYLNEVGKMYGINGTDTSNHNAINLAIWNSYLSGGI